MNSHKAPLLTKEQEDVEVKSQPQNLTQEYICGKLLEINKENEMIVESNNRIDNNSNWLSPSQIVGLYCLSYLIGVGTSSGAAYYITNDIALTILYGVLSSIVTPMFAIGFTKCVNNCAHMKKNKNDKKSIAQRNINIDKIARYNPLDGDGITQIIASYWKPKDKSFKRNDDSENSISPSVCVQTPSRSGD